MPVQEFSPPWPFLSALHSGPLRPLHAIVRRTGDRLRPTRIALHRPVVRTAQATILSRPIAHLDEAATITREIGTGKMPTIVLGGLVPDATEQVFLLRRFLLKFGDVYYVNFPRTRFSLDMICAQLSDLTEELGAAGQPAVVFAVSFGAGIAMEWLRRLRVAKVSGPVLRGIVLVSPVSCVDDVIAPGTAKPATLLGRALVPFLHPTTPPSDAAVEKSRVIFLRMFEAGAQNRSALRLLMSEAEVIHLRDAVKATIQGISLDGARARVRALSEMIAPTSYFSPLVLPLSPAPALLLFAEQEEAVLDANAPVRLALERAHSAYFPHGRSMVIGSRSGPPVQHASLIFHFFDFLPPLQAFYHHVRRTTALPLAA